MNNIEHLKEELASQGILKLHVKVHAGAKQTGFKSILSDGTIKIDIVKIAEDGQANEVLVKFLADEFDVPRQNIEILLGKFSGDKIIKIVKD